MRKGRHDKRILKWRRYLGHYERIAHAQPISNARAYVSRLRRRNKRKWWPV